MSFINHRSTENPISFSQMPWKNGLPKKIALEYDLSCIIGKDDISRKKIHGDMIFSSNVPKRWSFQKDTTGIWSFLYYLERWYFLLRQHGKIIFLKKYMEIWYLLYIRINVINMTLYPLLPKKSKMIFSHKNTLKRDRNSRIYSKKSSNDSLYFYEDLYRRFHILLSSEKNQET